MTTPNGYPAWKHTSNHETYGGDLNKRNYQSQGSVNAQTDVDVAGFCRMAEDLAECTRTAPFAIISWTCNDSSPAAPTITAANIMTGISTSYEGDAAPAGCPSGSRNGDGDCSFVFPATPTDDYGVSADLDSLIHLLPSSRTSGVTATAELTATTTVRVRLVDVGTGTGSADAEGTLVVSS
jgi:hypothetical protein